MVVHDRDASDPPKPPKQEQEQATTDITEVAPGVLRTQLPIDLPGLGHVNCYVMEDERGIAVVDPGLPGEDSWKALNDRLHRAGYEVEDIHTVVITHSHFDHFGSSDRIRETTGAEIVTHESFRVLWNGREVAEHEDSAELIEASPAEQEAEIDRIFAERLPWGSPRSRPPQAQLDRMREMGQFSNTWLRTPRSTRPLADAQTIRLGRTEWVAVHTPGHTHDHLCLYEPGHGVMLSGDHVLPTITPHITGISPDVDPLARFFASLHKMGTFEDVSVVLPAHGHPFADLGKRANEIIEHHEHRLDIIRDATAAVGAGSVTDYMRVLFSERAWGDMAESETFAHLEHLKVLGDLRRSNPDGVARYTLGDDRSLDGLSVPHQRQCPNSSIH
jgi:glyoxylase-like metal-dependent hydrolase (beta-lactamase superfamily II)